LEYLLKQLAYLVIALTGNLGDLPDFVYDEIII
jgi:hypothetical protein